VKTLHDQIGASAREGYRERKNTKTEISKEKSAAVDLHYDGAPLGGLGKVKNGNSLCQDSIGKAFFLLWGGSTSHTL